VQVCEEQKLEIRVAVVLVAHVKNADFTSKRVQCLNEVPQDRSCPRIIEAEEWD